MSLTVETGSGSATADALISLAACGDYHTARGNADWTGTDALKEAAIRRATAYLSNGHQWDGLRSHGRSQALAWPRAGVVDFEGYGIPSDEIPVEIVHACAEAALRELVEPGALTPDVVLSDLVKREKVGPLETEYANSAVSVEAHRPVMTIVRDLISPFLAKTGGSGIAGSVYRA